MSFAPTATRLTDGLAQMRHEPEEEKQNGGFPRYAEVS